MDQFTRVTSLTLSLARCRVCGWLYYRDTGLELDQFKCLTVTLFCASGWLSCHCQCQAVPGASNRNSYAGSLRNTTLNTHWHRLRPLSSSVEINARPGPGNASFKFPTRLLHPLSVVSAAASVPDLSRRRCVGEWSWSSKRRDLAELLPTFNTGAPVAVDSMSAPDMAEQMHSTLARALVLAPPALR